MPVHSEHPSYVKHKATWLKCRHVCEGEDEVKRQGDIYLPTLKKQSSSDYEAYKYRAMFYSASERTLAGLLGAVFRKPPIMEPESLKAEKVGRQGETLFTIALQILLEVLMESRVGVLVDSEKEEGRSPYIVLYKTESIVNWKYEAFDDGLKLVLLVLKEKYQEEGYGDEYEHKYKEQYRVLKIEDGIYKGEIHRAETGGKWSIHEEYVPKIVGQSMKDIPFTFINPIDDTQDIHNPPILPVVNVNLSHYRSSADLENGRHFCGLPIPYAAGFDIEGDEFRVGSETGYVSKDPNAKIGFGEFGGQGLTFLENALKDKEQIMAVLGARLLEQSKAGVEKPEAMRLRQVGEHNSLRQIANSVSGALTKVVGWWNEWTKKGMTGINIQLNTDFLSDKMSPGELKELMFGWQSGGMSWEVLFHNMKKGEMYPEGHTMADERDLIDAEISNPTKEE